MVHRGGGGQPLDGGTMVHSRVELCAPHPTHTIEDGMREYDWDGGAALRELLGGKVKLVGDDIFVSSPQRLAEGIGKGVANTILVKVNQIGTLSETLEA